MNAEHTPGPWTAGWSKYTEGTFIVKAGMPSNCVLASFDGDGDGPDDQSIADACLIAAAPDLLEALQKLSEVSKLQSDAVKNGGALVPFDVPSALVNAYAAISKATSIPLPEGE